MFWIKPKEIVVDCFTHMPNVYAGYKPAPAIDFIPEGWKRLPKTVGVQYDPDSNVTIPHATMKYCKGFTSLFASGFIIPLFIDMIFDTTKPDKVERYSPSNVNHWGDHPKFQMWDGLYNGHKHVKIMNPWCFVEKTGVKFAWNRCDWNNTDNAGNYHVLSAVTEFKYQVATQINMFVKDNIHLKLEAGQPMVHLIPLTENKVKFKHHLITKDEYERKFRVNLAKFAGNYNEVKRIKDKNAEESKCPFGFGK